MNDKEVSKRKKQVRLASFFASVFCMLLLCMITASARDVQTEYGGITVTAAVNPKNTEEITVTLTPDADFFNAKKGETLYLFVLAPYEAETAENLRVSSPTATKVVDKNTVFTVTADTQGERYRAKYVLALGEGANYRIVAVTYPENPEVLADNTAIRTKTDSIKGVVASQTLMADVQTLGVSHAVIPIVIDDYLTADAADSACSYATSGTRTHFDPTKIAQLDAQVDALRDTGIHILFRFLLNGSDRNTTQPASALYAANAAENAAGYGISVENKLAYQTANNIFTFFSERYAQTGEPIDFILGYQVNEWENWYQLGYGAQEAEQAAKAYAAAFRLADTALRSVSAQSRVYIPLSNLFASAKPFLRAFAKEMGGSAWSVAVAPYASDPMDDSIWDDPNASDSLNTVYLTMNNLELLKTFLSEEPFLYHGAMRAVIIDDFSVHGTSGDTASQERQAASFVYAYYKASMLDFLDAFIWHRITDGAGEHCSLGLRQLDNTEKPVYRLFCVIDTQLGGSAAAEYAKIIGERKWSQVISGFSLKYANRNIRIEGTGETVDLQTNGDNTNGTSGFGTLFCDFSDYTLNGFQPSEFTSKTEAITAEAVIGGAQKQTTLLSVDAFPMGTLSADAAVYSGITRLLSKGELPENTRKLYMTLKAEVPENGAEVVSVRLILGKTADAKNGKRVIYDGETQIPAGSFTTVVFDIGEFVQKAGADGADYMKLLVGGLNIAASAATDQTESENGASSVGGRFYLDEIRLVSGIHIPVLNILIGIFIVIAVLVIVFFLLVLRAQYIRKKKRRQRAAQRAAMARRRQQQQQMQQRNRLQTTASDRRTSGENRPRRTAQRRPDLYYRDNQRRK